MFEGKGLNHLNLYQPNTHLIAANVLRTYEVRFCRILAERSIVAVCPLLYAVCHFLQLLQHANNILKYLSKEIYAGFFMEP
jgi:hypothetical protein